MKISVFLKIFITLACLMAINLYAETAKEAETTRGNCNEGDVEETFWFTFTDTDGDGKWDWISGKKCDGTLENRPLEENEMSMGRSINGQTSNVISGDIVSGSSFIIELLDGYNNEVAHLIFNHTTQSYSLNWLPITPGINNPSRSSNRENEENRLSEKDLSLINKMIKIYKGNDFDFQLYPNPSNNLLKIKTKNFKPNTYNVVISNLDGNTQLNQDYNFGDNELLEINIGTLSNGVYIISIYTESQTISKKFVVE